MTPRRDQGFALVSAFLILAVFLAYSGGMTVRATTQQLATRRLQERTQALQLAQGSLDQLREDLYGYLSNYLVALVHQGDATEAFKWLDKLGTTPRSEDPFFAVPKTDLPPIGNNNGRLDWGDIDLATRDATQDNPRCPPPLAGQALLPTIKAVTTGQQPACNPASNASLPLEQPRAWIVSVTNPTPLVQLAPRFVTMDAEARAGATTKRLRATYRVDMGISDIFRYAYFVNNYGWFDAGSKATITVNGEVRANADLDFKGANKLGNGFYSANYNITNISLNGDLYASNNPDLKNPSSGNQATGKITGDPDQPWDWMDYFWRKRSHSQSSLAGPYLNNGYWFTAADSDRWRSQVRPARSLVDPLSSNIITGKSQTPPPPISGTPTILPLGSGWNDLYTKTKDTTTVVDQQRFESQPVHDMPYIGDLSFYTTLGKALGSKLQYLDSSNQLKTIDTANPYTSQVPLVLIGTDSNPITISGPVVIPTDVIIKGVVKGRGTIYAGRNVHVIGEVTYKAPPSWPLLWRQTQSGAITDNDTNEFRGWVCNNGTYVPPTGTAPANCT